MKRYMLVWSLLLSLMLFPSCADDISSKMDLRNESKSFSDNGADIFIQTLSQIKEKIYNPDCTWEGADGGECELFIIHDPQDLNVFNFRDAYEHFQEAVMMNPENLDAQLGASVTRFLTVFSSEEFIRLRDSWWLKGDKFEINAQNISEEKFKIIQFIDTILLPAVDYSLARLAVLDRPQNKHYTYILHSNLLEASSQNYIEVDMGDIKLYHSFLLGMRSLILASKIYHLEFNDATLEGIANAFNKGSDLLTLEHPEYAIPAHSLAISSIDKGLEAVNFLLTENDDQKDDLLKRNGETIYNIGQYKDILLEAKKALTQIYQVENNEALINFNIPAFLNNLPEDLKELLPDYSVEITDDKLTFRYQANSSQLLTFPDLTFSGLLSDSLTQDELKLFFDIYECTENVSCPTMMHCSDENICVNGRYCEFDKDCLYGQSCNVNINLCEA